jgi:hypothetical protein
MLGAGRPFRAWKCLAKAFRLSGFQILRFSDFQTFRLSGFKPLSL